ncbi:MAG: OmpA family protein [Myxococcales bacterium]|nr:OmpA family protein [Myxococcales bacterium]MCB9582729.1 OmpA family protein [Polyangiaceae bacterium]
MRALPVIAALLFAVPAFADDGGAAGSEEKLPPLKVTVDRDKVDLDAHRLELSMSREAKSVKIRVLAEDGSELAEQEHDFSGKPAGATLVVTWQPKSDDAVARIELYAYDAHGYWKGVALTPWSVKIPHQEVLFDTNKALIKKSEEPKLEESYARIQKAIEEHKEIGAIKLYVAGHTDTVGTPAHNLTLSRKRAQAIAQWFKKRGLANPVYFAGFGESVLAVKTKDEVSEAKNRRVDYILAIEPPAMKSGGGVPWKAL